LLTKKVDKFHLWLKTVASLFPFSFMTFFISVQKWLSLKQNSLNNPL